MPQNKAPRKTSDTASRAPSTSTPTAPGTETGESASAEAGAQLTRTEVSRTMEAVLERGADVADRAVGETAADASVKDELSGGGVAFGEFVKSVGLAVAAAQTELDKNLRETAKQLSETQIDVVAVFEQVTNDDDGSMADGVPHLQKLPLINYLMPTAYAWKRVHLEADMNVQEFNTRSGFNIQQNSFAAGAGVRGGFGLFGAGFSASAYANYSNNNTSVDSSNSLNYAAGKLHMEATLEPRSDVELPKPFVLQKGPKLELQVGSRKPVPAEGNPKEIVGQEVQLTATLSKTDGKPHDKGKALSVTVSDPMLSYSSPGTTDDQGEMQIVVSRRVVDQADDKPVQALVRVSFGLVTSTAGIAI
jgi:hypothetical protein